MCEHGHRAFFVEQKSHTYYFCKLACLSSPAFFFPILFFFLYFSTVPLFADYFLSFFYSLFPSLLKIPRLQRFQRATMHAEIQRIIIPISLYPREKCVSSGCKRDRHDSEAAVSLILDIVLRAQKDLDCFFFSSPVSPASGFAADTVSWLSSLRLASLSRVL